MPRFPEIFDDTFGRRLGASCGRSAQRDVDFAVGTFLFYICAHVLLHLDGLEYLVGIDYAAVKIIHNHFISYLGVLGDEDVDFLAGLIVRENIPEELVGLGRGDYTTGSVIYIDINQLDTSAAHFGALLAVRHKAIFWEAPLQEGAGVVDGCHLQKCELARKGIGPFGGGDGTVLRVPVYKYFYPVADGGVLRQVTCRYKNFGTAVAFRMKVCAEFHHPAYGEFLDLSRLYHRYS